MSLYVDLYERHVLELVPVQSVEWHLNCGLTATAPSQTSRARPQPTIDLRNIHDTRALVVGERDLVSAQAPTERCEGLVWTRDRFERFDGFRLVEEAVAVDPEVRPPVYHPASPIKERPQKRQLTIYLSADVPVRVADANLEGG
jgi:hypothetical protein